MRSDYQAEVQFKETGQLRNQETKDHTQGTCEGNNAGPSLGNEKTNWHRGKGKRDLNTQGRQLDTADTH